jgi:hypothetical protein
LKDEIDKKKLIKKPTKEKKATNKIQIKFDRKNPTRMKFNEKI